MPYRAAVIGLGNIGFKFSFDTKRTGTWTHVDAYSRCPATTLVGAVEIDPATVAQFHTLFPHIPVFNSVRELCENVSPDIVSIAVPTPYHHQIFCELTEYPVRALFCEKPMSLSPVTSREMVTRARRKNIVVAVNYTRRWQNSYRNIKKIIKEGKIGKLQTIHAFYPGQIYNIGSHLFDAIRMLGDIEPVSISAVKNNGGSDPSLSGWILIRDGALVTFSVTGKREDLVFEIDLVGDQGRIKSHNNGNATDYFLFKESTHYSGYRELVKETIVVPPENDRFVDAVQDIASVLDGRNLDVQCTGFDGLAVDTLIGAALGSSARNGTPVDVKIE